jgi:hypothetical protein
MKEVKRYSDYAVEVSGAIYVSRPHRTKEDAERKAGERLRDHPGGTAVVLPYWLTWAIQQTVGATAGSGFSEVGAKLERRRARDTPSISGRGRPRASRPDLAYRRHRVDARRRRPPPIRGLSLGVWREWS